MNDPYLARVLHMIGTPPAYKVGRTVCTSKEYPDGVPCVIYDGDSVLCEFPGSDGEENARAVCRLMNAHGWNVPSPVKQDTGD